MEGRRIRGEGLEHEQDYIRERLEQAGDVDEYTEAAEVLEQESKDLQSLENRSEQPGRSGDTSTLRQTATMPVEQDELRQGAALNVSSGSSGADPQQLPPDAEARGQVVSQLDGGSGGSEPGR